MMKQPDKLLEVVGSFSEAETMRPPAGCRKRKSSPRANTDPRIY